MTRRIVSLTISAIDELAQLSRLQLLLNVCLDELQSPASESEFRAELLVDCYRSRAEYHLDELRLRLEGIREQLSKDA